jgi:hypothetical protein
MEVFSKEFKVGLLRIEMSVQDSFRHVVTNEAGSYTLKNFTVYLTAHDIDGRRIWVTPIMDSHGQVKIYSSVEEAVLDARHKLGIQSASTVDFSKKFGGRS